MSVLKVVATRHFQIGTMTACGLRGIAHRAIVATTDLNRVTCRSCWKSPLFHASIPEGELRALDGNR